MNLIKSKNFVAIHIASDVFLNTGKGSVCVPVSRGESRQYQASAKVWKRIIKRAWRMLTRAYGDVFSKPQNNTSDWIVLNTALNDIPDEWFDETEKYWSDRVSEEYAKMIATELQSTNR